MAKVKQNSFVIFPCLRCGNPSVPILLTFLPFDKFRDVYHCRYCQTEHLLAYSISGKGPWVIYQRYTLRYSIDAYDEGALPDVVRLTPIKNMGKNFEGPTGPGPITIFPRKKYYSKEDIKVIFEASNGKCHICNKKWDIGERGLHGWHVDHIIPHAGAGFDSEYLRNLRVACARCNLKKGKGYSEKTIKYAVVNLICELQERRRRVEAARLKAGKKKSNKGR